MKAALALVTLLAALFAGCDSEPIGSGGRSAAPEAFGVNTSISVENPGTAAPASAPTGTGSNTLPPPQPPPPPPPPSAQVAGEQAAPAAETPAPVTQQSERVAADTGVGKKGRYDPGLVTTPVSAYWRTQESIAFRIQIPSAMQLYKADKGRAPQSHEEFMEQIIKPNQIQLPVLPEGERYIYDPATEQLMVERPAS